MASSWGASWGSSWGSSWGALARHVAGKIYGPTPRRKHKPADRRETIEYAVEVLKRAEERATEATKPAQRKQAEKATEAIRAGLLALDDAAVAERVETALETAVQAERFATYLRSLKEIADAIRVTMEVAQRRAEEARLAAEDEEDVLMLLAAM